MRRLLHLLYWQAQFDARRALVWVCGLGYLLVMGPCTLGLLQLIRGGMGLPLSGSAYLAALTISHAIGSTLYVSCLAARAADERSTGFLAVVQMTDLPAFTLTAFRFLAGLVQFSPLWLMRLPLYVWCYYLGGVPLADFLAAEALLLLVTIVALTIAMACSQVTRSLPAAISLISGVVIASQLAFYLPRLLMGLVRLTFGPLQGPLGDLNEWALAFSRLSLAGWLRLPPQDATDWRSFLPALVIHLAMALIGLAITRYLAFVNVLPDDSPRQANAARPPRRVVGDAIAWQARYIHHNRGTLRDKSLGFEVLLIALLFVAQFTLTPLAAGFLAIGLAFRALSTAAMRAGVCAYNEIRDHTLSTLAMLPRDALDFFRSWRAGGFRASIPEYCSAAIAALFIAWNMGDSAAGMFGVMFAMLLAAPFGVLNSLCRFEWAVLTLALWMFPTGMACVVLSIVVGATVNPWLGLGLFCLLALPFHYLIVRQIPYYFQRAVERS